MQGSRPRASFSAAIGAVTTPTPIGRFSVTDSLATGDPSGPFGWYAFGLSGHQSHLPPNWSGGDQLAIHGTDDSTSIGTAASHGCLRGSPSWPRRSCTAHSLHTAAPMAATAPPAVLPRRIDGPAHRQVLRTHSTPIRYPHSLHAATSGLRSVGLRRLPVR
jgi:hypothetical protein